MTTLKYGSPGNIHEVRDGAEWIVQNIPQCHPMPALPRDKANLLALYNLRVTGMREAVFGPGALPAWIVYVRPITQVMESWAKDKMLVLSDSTESWISEVIEYTRKVDSGPAPMTADEIKLRINQVTGMPCKPYKVRRAGP